MIVVAMLLGLAALSAPAQPPDTAGTPPPPRARYIVPMPTDSSAVAARAATPPVIDGRQDDAVWRVTPPITQFEEWQPTEGARPRFRTMAKVAYDASALYVFVRCYDPHPDRIIRILERRDTFTPSDMVWVFVDSYHDRRTGYEFGVNAAGVKIDQAIYDDGREDGAWDAVWEVATRIDSLGWTAEYRIPLSQLRFGTDSTHTFGLTIDRDTYRFSERVSWPVLRQSRPGLVSQFGTLTGLKDLDAPRRLEATPYLVTRNANTIVGNRFADRTSVTAGGDLKYRLASNLTLNATINPDFGQVEADPAVLNLTAYESFFDERRPFFVAGRGLFQFDVNCTEVNCNNDALYYSRRIGRAPQLAGVYGDTVPQQPTTILGAAKLLGRFPSGLTLGVLDATTEKATGPGGRTFEPLTNFGVARVTQDFRNGNSTVGAMLTAVNRHQDAWTSPYLPSAAYAGGLDFRHRFLHDDYQLAGFVSGSRVLGSAAAMTALQRDAVHDFQRPDGPLAVDSAARALGGDAEQIRFGKVGGQHLLFETSYGRFSPGFEVNDIGYLQRADEQQWNTWVGFFDRHQRSWYNRFQWNMNWWQFWSASGLPLEAAYNTNLHIQSRNYWSWNIGATLGQLAATYDDRAARGGPAVRQDAYLSPWLDIVGDQQRAIVPQLYAGDHIGRGGHVHSLTLRPEIDIKAWGRFSSSVALAWTRNVTDDQWFGNFTDTAGATHYTFAHLRQTTLSATVRLNYTFTPTLSLQAYLQPFVSKGTYSDVRQLSATPGAARYRDRYAPYDDPAVTNDPGGFDFKELQSNVVLRWEYRPGSTLFVVWSEGRQGYAPTAGTEGLGGDVRDLLALHPQNTVLVKLAYWLNR